MSAQKPAIESMRETQSHIFWALKGRYFSGTSRYWGNGRVILVFELIGTACSAMAGLDGKKPPRQLAYTTAAVA